jgi:hypothetical protein
MKSFFGLLILGVFTAASLSMWPHAEVDNKIASQDMGIGKNEGMGKTYFNKMFFHDTHLIMAKEGFNYKIASFKD